MSRFIVAFGLMWSGALAGPGSAWGMTCEEVEAMFQARAPAFVVADALKKDGVKDPFLRIAHCRGLRGDLAEEEAATLREQARRERLEEKASREPTVVYRERVEIDFEGVDVQGELVKPQAALLLDRRKASYNGLIRRRQSFEGNTERFESPGPRDAELSARDDLSTFSIDVDTGSWTFARRRLIQGSLPTPEMVRTEEFVNWLTYRYAPPDPGTRPFAVHMEAAPSPVDPSKHLMRIGIKAAEPPVERKPVRLTFLVDTSGSMRSSDKLPLAVQALKRLVEQLDDDDHIAIGTYAGATKRVLGPTPVRHRERILDALDSLRSAGGTAMGSGMAMAYAMASNMYDADAENRVIVLSDGDANIGPVSHDQILASIRDHADRGITMTTVGFGTGNYNDTMMEQLANKGDGNYFYVDSFKEAERIFGTEVAGTLVTVARDVKIQVAFDPDVVRAYRLLGYENRDLADEDFDDDEVDAGEVGAGHAVTAFYEVVLADGAEAADSLAEVRIRAKPPGPDARSRKWTTGFDVRALAPGFDATSVDFQLGWAMATFAQKLRRDNAAAEVSWSTLLEVVDRHGYDPKHEDLREALLAASRLSEAGVAAR